MMGLRGPYFYDCIILPTRISLARPELTHSTLSIASCMFYKPIQHPSATLPAVLNQEDQSVTTFGAFVC